MRTKGGRFLPSKKYAQDLNENLIIEMYTDGDSVRKIATLMKSYPKKIQKILKNNNIDFRSKKCYLSGPSNPKYTGYEEMQGAFLATIKASAKKRNLVFEVSYKYLWDLFITQNRKCAYSGIEIFFSRNNIEHINGDATASLDRIDSSKGYVEGNLQWLHKRINVMKGNMSEQEFLNFCEAVTFKNKNQEIQETFSHSERK
jgi:hypothetical protein